MKRNQKIINIKEKTEKIPKKEKIENINKINYINKIDINKIKNTKKEESKNNDDVYLVDIDKRKGYISAFGKIYDSFSNNLSINNKVNIFESNILDNYFEELDLNYEESKERKNKIFLKEFIEEKKENLKNLDDNIINNDNDIIKEAKYMNNYNIDNNYIIEYKEKNNNIILKHCYFTLLKEIDYHLYNNYTPVSYENNDINIKKYQNLLSILINKNNFLEPIGYIASLLIEEILSNNIDLSKINIFNNLEIKNKIINILLLSFKNKSNSNNQKFLNSKKVLDILNTENYNYINYNFLSNEQSNSDPIDFVINLFNSNILNKINNISYFYLILLNICENNYKEYLKEIFDNFDLYLFVIFKYFDKKEDKIKKISELLVNSFYPKMTFCQYIILKILLGSHEIINEKFYAKIFTSFLNFSSMEKLLITDCYNLILFTINSKVKKIFAKCSILIKYKYSLLKQNYKQDENDIILKYKINENIMQFGEIHNNKYFENYLKNEFCEKYNNIKNILNNRNENIIFKENEDENKINDIKELNQKEEQNKKEEKNNNSNNNRGFFSSIKFAFGFGNDNSINNKE